MRLYGCLCLFVGLSAGLPGSVMDEIFGRGDLLGAVKNRYVSGM